MDLFTIGYGDSSQASVVAALQAAGVRTLIDVRELPLSRRPGFSKGNLSAGLAAAGIGYLHLKGLGTPKEGRLANRAGRWAEFEAIVAAKLTTPEAQHDLARVAAVAMESPAALLCLCVDAEKCHRSHVAVALAQAHGFTVRHLSAPAVA